MSEDIECSIAVSKVSDVVTDGRAVTVILKEQKTAHQRFFRGEEI